MDASYYEQDALWGAEHVENQDQLVLRYAAIDSLLPRQAKTIIDAGAGDGRVLVDLADRRPGLFTVGVDRSRTALAHHRGRNVASSIESIGLATDSADAVLCCEVLEHLPQPILDQATNELSRVARSWIVITVPNRENRRRGAVRCPLCSCEYNPFRHLRSFSDHTLVNLVPGFRLVRTIEAGPRVALYPRWLRRTLESTGVVRRSDAPSCPQCGASLVHQRDRSAPHRGPALRTTGGMARTLVPKGRRRYWLCALFERA